MQMPDFALAARVLAVIPTLGLTNSATPVDLENLESQSLCRMNG
jgi:hypothetical protein